LESFAWDLSLGIFRLGTFAWELPRGFFFGKMTCGVKGFCVYVCAVKGFCVSAFMCVYVVSAFMCVSVVYAFMCVSEVSAAGWSLRQRVRTLLGKPS